VRSLRNPNPDESHPSHCINPCIEPQNFLLRLAAHVRDFENCLRYVMEMEERELDMEMWESWAIDVRNECMNLYAVYSRPEVLNWDGPMSFIAQITCIVVDQKLICLEAFECKWLYIETMYWQSIMTVFIMRTIVEHPMTVSMSLSWESTERQRSVNGASTERQRSVNGASTERQRSVNGASMVHLRF